MWPVWLIVALAGLAGAWHFGWLELPERANRSPPPAKPYVRINGQRFTVRLATTEETRRRGLGGVRRLPADEGMLFVYPRAEPPEAMKFWMKDCLIDLDVAFISPDRRIVTIHTMKAQPGAPDEELTPYQATGWTQFALEVGAGQLAARGIVPGDAAEFSPEVDKAIGGAE